MTNKSCSNCGEPILEGRKICTNCGKPLCSKDECSSAKNQPGSENVIYIKEKSTAAAIILSFAYTGAGQIHNGRLKKGLLMMVGFWVGMIFLFIPSLIIWVYSMYDAYKEADKMNKGEIPYIESTAKDAVIYIAAYMVIGIIAVTLWMGLLFLPLMFI